jgi:hypothetical protein
MAEALGQQNDNEPYVDWTGFPRIQTYELQYHSQFFSGKLYVEYTTLQHVYN